MKEVEEVRADARATLQALEASRAEINNLEEIVRQREEALATAERCQGENDLVIGGLRAEIETLRRGNFQEGEKTTDHPRRAVQKELQDELRIGQLQAKYAELRVGMSTREVLRLFGDPINIEDVNDFVSTNLIPCQATALSGAVKATEVHREETQAWTYEAPPWGGVRMDIVHGRVVKLYWLDQYTHAS
jgi:hypothetical protein